MHCDACGLGSSTFFFITKHHDINGVFKFYKLNCFALIKYLQNCLHVMRIYLKRTTKTIFQSANICN